MKILVADDDPQLVRALGVTLSARGYDVVTARDGRAAIDAVITERPDLVMLDLGMPRLDGVEVIAGLRGWSTAPVLVVSGRTDAADKVEALDAGADDYVTKPFAMEELLARIRALTRRLAPGDDDAPAVSDSLGIVDESLEGVEYRESLKPLLERLPPREKRILLLRFFGNMTQSQIATELGISQMHVSRLLARTLAQLREGLTAED